MGAKGPRVVAIGGGHGLAVTLRAAATYAGELTGVVSVADDGGSSGRLRESLGLPAMGDLRRCLSALADPSIALAAVFERRFEPGPDGHALGNLLIAAMAEQMGDFTEAVAYFAHLLGVRAALLPATAEVVNLCADTAGGRVVGQVAVQHAARIESVWLEPEAPEASKEAVAATLAADQVVIGPGSLYTSVLAALAVPALRDAVANTDGTRVYVCNLRPQQPETAGYDVAAHVAALRAHGIAPDVIVCNPESLPLGEVDVELFEAPIAADHGLAHDADRLAAALSSLL